MRGCRRAGLEAVAEFDESVVEPDHEDRGQEEDGEADEDENEGAHIRKSVGWVVKYYPRWAETTTPKMRGRRLRGDYKSPLRLHSSPFLAARVSKFAIEALVLLRFLSYF